MARSGARRKQRPTPKPQARGSRPAASTRHEFTAAEAAMFFPKLRRQAKWVFVFLALTFAIGFVAFGVGSGGNGIGDIFQGLQRGSSSGPSVGDAQKKIAKGNLAAYKELTEAYRVEGKQDDAIAAGEKYLAARPKGYDFRRGLAGDDEARAARHGDVVAGLQSEVVGSRAWAWLWLRSQGRQ